MNAEQQKFYDYVMDKVMDNKREELKEVLAECFRKMGENQLSKGDIESTAEILTPLLRPKYREEVRNVMLDFADDFRKQVGNK